ncbi:MAG: arsenite methyltransferase [Bacteroidota bacterium]
METPDDLKNVVREKYAAIAGQSREENASSCCGTGGCCTVDYAVFAEDYTRLKGYQKEADLGLGCGIPTEFARISAGDTVVDLGSGAGNDVFVARTIVGDSGKVIGVDMTEAMIEKARANNAKLGFHNVEFRLGDIEKLPLTAQTADVVISNCVLNLVPNKAKAFSEIFRVLKTGGHFSISDIVISGNLPRSIREAAEMYAGCVSGAIDRDAYLALITNAGFTDVRVVKVKPIHLPDELLLQYLSEDELREFRASGTAITSITIYGRKEACCPPSTGCC